ncbi:MAG: ATP-dependent DNA helicase RecG [Alphaproteobacteria bacterium]|nr:ATP-dependent DNA helicase RecG [Alphaproteobacteria bacterium]HCP01659.1 ATP-dependent DNA helicase RecG [Rhodospirillaceae bacterium]
MPQRTRPEILFPLFAPVTVLKGVGSRIGAHIERLAGSQIIDLLWHLPVGVIDRRYSPNLVDLEPGRVATLELTVVKHHAPPTKNRRVPYRIDCRDKTGEITLIYFHGRSDYLLSVLPAGETRLISGTAEVYDGKLQMTHPDIVANLDERESVMRVQPVYALTEGLSQNVLGKVIAGAIDRTSNLPEWLDPALVAKREWKPWQAALVSAHAPDGPLTLDPAAPARMRLAYDELLASQLAIMLVRSHVRRQAGRAIEGDGRLRSRVLSVLPFRLTDSQNTAIDEISVDMAADSRMLRLLQGDVGSGKTIVALVAMLTAVEAGGQAALMAPTEILAQQHYATIAPLAEAAGVPCVLLTGRYKGKARTTILAGLANGSTPIVVGTHALFQDDIAFDDLAIVVVDEQHRFGVHQRLLLAEKGSAVDVLLMTATPIPRTLMLAAYGDLDESQLREKPAGRKPVTTTTASIDRLNDAIAGVQRHLDSGGKVFWVCPLVEESEAIDVAAATARHSALNQRFGGRVGLVHGKMSGKEKDEVMSRFAGGAEPAVDILVATTVIEVGVDVPDATVMVIEHAERFGLAQLHQLRGRIGRGDRVGTCLLLYGHDIGATGRERLRVLRDTDDGFQIAEQDLRLRGAGDVLGTRQSGLPDFRVVDLNAHGELLAVARDDAQLILARDPALKTARGQALRTLLYLFERDAAIRFTRAG